MSTAPYPLLERARTASVPLPTTSATYTSFSSIARASFWLIALSSAIRTFGRDRVLVSKGPTLLDLLGSIIFSVTTPMHRPTTASAVTSPITLRLSALGDRALSGSTEASGGRDRSAVQRPSASRADDWSGPSRYFSPHIPPQPPPFAAVRRGPLLTAKSRL